MSKDRVFGGFLLLTSTAAVALLILSIDPPSSTVNETQFTKLGYHVERTSIGEIGRFAYGPMNAVLWVNGCRVEVEWREGERRDQPGRWVIAEPSLPPSIGQSRPELTTAHEYRMSLHGHSCLDKKTPGYVLRAPGLKDPS